MKYEDITPAEFRCAFSASCPSITRAADGSSYHVTGRLTKQVEPIAGSDFQYEATVEIDAKLLEGALKAILAEK